MFPVSSTFYFSSDILPLVRDVKCLSKRRVFNTSAQGPRLYGDIGVLMTPQFAMDFKSESGRSF